MNQSLHAVRPDRPDMDGPAHGVWDRLTGEARHACATEPLLRGLITENILAKPGFYPALTHLLSRKLAGEGQPAALWEALFHEAAACSPSILAASEDDLAAVLARDPAAENALTPFLGYKGFHALQCHRVGHWLWSCGRHTVAHLLQSRVSELFAVDIHPAVPVGRRVFIDHGTGIVIGQTAVIGNDVSILQNVTLGGTGKDQGDRHPKIRDGVLLSTGATVLGNIEIGEGATVGAGSVVLKHVPPHATAVGVPARIVGVRKPTSGCLFKGSDEAAKAHQVVMYAGHISNDPSQVPEIV